MAYAVPAGAGLFDTAATLLKAGTAAVTGGETEVDLGAVRECDSSLLACVLAWRRAAAAHGAALTLKNAPRNLDRIARLYGVEDLALN
ncbi:MAG: NTP-binding protein [Betaproteobacteria bacterium]|nr:NTP-binding protein [Betaproteobacteria bacterium]